MSQKAVKARARARARVRARAQPWAIAMTSTVVIHVLSSLLQSHGNLTSGYIIPINFQISFLSVISLYVV